MSIIAARSGASSGLWYNRWFAWCYAIDPRYARFRLRIGQSAIHRWGVYAEEPIPPRRKVIEYTGERISRAETKKRGQGPRTYLFTLDDYWTIDGSGWRQRRGDHQP